MHLISCDTKTQGTVLCALAPYCTEGQFYVLRTQNRPLCHICKWRDKTKGHGLLARVPTVLSFKSVLFFSCGGTPSHTLQAFVKAPTKLSLFLFIISLSLLSAYPHLPLSSPNWCRISPRAYPLPCTNMNMQSPHRAFSSARL